MGKTGKLITYAGQAVFGIFAFFGFFCSLSIAFYDVGWLGGILFVLFLPVGYLLIPLWAVYEHGYWTAAIYSYVMPFLALALTWLGLSMSKE